jgi:hypothetical protein
MNVGDVRKILNSAKFTMWKNIGYIIWNYVDYATWDDNTSISISRTARNPVEASVIDYFKQK